VIAVKDAQGRIKLNQLINTTAVGAVSGTFLGTFIGLIGDPSAWAQETFQVAKDDAFGQLPTPNARGSYRLTDEYITTATQDVSDQLSKAGVRLAFTLNQALRK
jgi:hypothetical protein